MTFRVLTVPVRVLAFALWFSAEILRSSGKVFGDILSPGVGATPRVVRLPLGGAGDGHVTMLGVLITLTPGTLTLGLVDEPGGGRSLLVHSMYHADTASALADLGGMDRRMMRAVRIGEPA